MKNAKWPHEPADPFLELKVPRIYGNVPSLFASPVADEAADLRGFDVAFLGIPWEAPVPDSRVGAAAANYAGTSLTPGRFRTQSIRYGGYLPELDLDVFERFRFIDYGNVDVAFDPDVTLANVERRVADIIEAGCVPVTMGGNGGLSSYPVLKAVAAHAGGPVAVVNFDAHHDNRYESAEDRADKRNPRWGGTWAGRILELPGVDPARYQLVGLRGPRNDRGAIPRYLERGVTREHIYTYREIKAARRQDIDALGELVAARAAAGAAKVWIAVDPDVLDMSVSPEFGDEPLGLHVTEIVEMVRAVARAAGPSRFGGLTFMAVPPDAATTQQICAYILLYTFAGLAEAKGA